MNPLQRKHQDLKRKDSAAIFLTLAITILAPLTLSILAEGFNARSLLLFGLFCCFTFSGLTKQLNRFDGAANAIGTLSFVLGGNMMFWANGGFFTIGSVWLFLVPVFVGVLLNTQYAFIAFALNTCSLLAGAYLQFYLGQDLILSASYNPANVSLTNAFMAVIVGYISLRSIFKSQDALNAAYQQFLEEQLRNIKLKDEFLSNMSHELRTPLNGIYGVLQIVKGKDEREAKLINAAANSSRALNRIVSDILDLQKISSGKLEVVPEWQSSEEFFALLKGIHCNVAQLKGIGFQLITHGLPDDIYIDGTRLGQVLNNIIGNAIKFTERGHVNVHATYRDENLNIEIKDTGIGMDQAALSHLFERFTQADASTSKKFAGTGLGMAISKDLLQLMGGSIEVDSTPNIGTTFNVRLPCNGKNTPKPVKIDKLLPTIDSSLRILVVDDVATNNLVAQDILKPYVAFVDTALSGAEALAKMTEGDFDLLITDIGMPEMTGDELLAAVKAQWPHLPVIALTGNASKEDREKYLSVGFDAVATKPFHLEDLLALISDVVETKKSA